MDDQNKCELEQIEKTQSETFLEEHCLPRCPLECNQRSLQPITVSYHRFHYSSRQLDFLNKRNSFISERLSYLRNQSDFVNHLADNLVEFVVYYDELAYTLIEEEPKMTLDEMVGTIGGHLHLFLGMSLMSFVELLEATVFVTVSGVKSWRSERNRCSV